MESDIARRLADLNRAFYQTFAAPFAATRTRVQPGAAKLLQRIPPGSSIIDIGCGNGNAAVWLSAHNPPRCYLGLDGSDRLLELAGSRSYSFPVEFRMADVIDERWSSPLAEQSFDFTLAFAVLHHIPGTARRLAFLRSCRRMLVPGGILYLSNWRFLRAEKLRRRIVAWETVGLKKADVDPGDYVLDWRHGGRGYRYVHIVEKPERKTLAEESGFREIETFESDGKGGRLADYAVWRAA